MVTAFILLPVAATLTWLYWYLLPDRKWLLKDSLILLLLIAVTAGYVQVVGKIDFDGRGVLWPYVVPAAGAYCIFTLGLSFALAWRRRNPKL